MNETNGKMTAASHDQTAFQGFKTVHTSAGPENQSVDDAIAADAS